MTITLAGLPSSDPLLETSRSFLIWGPVGAGKTPLLSTLPAPILWLMFDKGGAQSITHLKHRFQLFDFVSIPDKVTEEFMRPDTKLMKDIDAVLATGEFKSVVLDSLSSFLDKALAHGVVKAGTNLFTPELRGYGARGSIIKNAIYTLNTITTRNKVHFGMAAHEKESTDNKGVTTEVTFLLPGEAAVQIPKNVSEVWRLADTGKRRNIYVRNFGYYNPMRTRMFDATREFFEWKFNLDTWDGTTVLPGTLEYYLEEWRNNGGKKIPLPTEGKT